MLCNELRRCRGSKPYQYRRRSSMVLEGPGSHPWASHTAIHQGQEGCIPAQVQTRAYAEHLPPSISRPHDGSCICWGFHQDPTSRTKQEYCRHHGMDPERLQQGEYRRQSCHRGLDQLMSRQSSIPEVLCSS